MVFSAEALSATRRSLKQAPLPRVERPSVGAAVGITDRRGFDLADGAPEEVLKYQRFVVAFNIEHWLERLGGETFGTRCVDFDQVTAQASREHESAQLPLGLGLLELRERLQAEMTAMGGGCFVKSSSRSAKDYADPHQLRECFRSVLATLSESDSENAKMVAMSYASMALLRMPDAAKVFDVLARSERIWHDMKLALAAQVHAETRVRAPCGVGSPAASRGTTMSWRASVVFTVVAPCSRPTQTRRPEIQAWCRGAPISRTLGTASGSPSRLVAHWHGHP